MSESCELQRLGWLADFSQCQQGLAAEIGDVRRLDMSLGHQLWR
jgi:hypothetical protein